MNEKHFKELLQNADDAQLSRIARLSQIKEPAEETPFAEEETFEVKPAPRINWMLLTSAAAAIAVVGGVAALGFTMSRNMRPMIEPSAGMAESIPCAAPFYDDLAANPVYIGMSEQTLSEAQKQALYAALGQIDWTQELQLDGWYTDPTMGVYLSIGTPTEEQQNSIETEYHYVNFDPVQHHIEWKQNNSETAKLYVLTDEAYDAIYNAVFGIVKTQDERFEDNLAPFHDDLAANPVYIGMSDQMLSEVQKQALYAALGQIDWTQEIQLDGWLTDPHTGVFLSIATPWLEQLEYQQQDYYVYFNPEQHWIEWRQNAFENTPKFYVLTDEAYDAIYNAVYSEQGEMPEDVTEPVPVYADGEVPALIEANEQEKSWRGYVIQAAKLGDLPFAHTEEMEYTPDASVPETKALRVVYGSGEGDHPYISLTYTDQIPEGLPADAPEVISLEALAGMDAQTILTDEVYQFGGDHRFFVLDALTHRVNVSIHGCAESEVNALLYQLRTVNVTDQPADLDEAAAMDDLWQNEVLRTESIANLTLDTCEITNHAVKNAIPERSLFLHYEDTSRDPVPEFGILYTPYEEALLTDYGKPLTIEELMQLDAPTLLTDPAFQSADGGCGFVADIGVYRIAVICRNCDTEIAASFLHQLTHQYIADENGNAIEYPRFWLRPGINSHGETYAGAGQVRIERKNYHLLPDLIEFGSTSNYVRKDDLFAAFGDDPDSCMASYMQGYNKTENAVLVASINGYDCEGETVLNVTNYYKE